MMRLIIFGVIGLLVGLGGGTGVAVMGAKRTHAADSVAHAAQLKARRDSVEADSLAKKAVADSVAAVAASALAQPNAGSAPVRPGTVPNPTPSLPQLPKPSAPTTRQLAEATVAAGGRDNVAATSVSPARIAKIFAAMPARDAAKVMQEMSDDDIHVILGAMNDRQAAAILAGFPAERVARISRAAMHSAKASP